MRADSAAASTPAPRPGRSALPRRRSSDRRWLLLVLLLSLAALPRPAAAHHGWSSYDTTRPLFFSGALQEVRWENPHTEVLLTMPDPVGLPTNLGDLPIPQEFEAWGGREVLRATGVLTPSAEAYTLVLAPLTRMQAWSVTEPPAAGETLSGVGYLSRTTPGELRIELVILPDGRAVWLREAPEAGSAGAPVVELAFPPAEPAATAAAPTAEPTTVVEATAAPTAASATVAPTLAATLPPAGAAPADAATAPAQPAPGSTWPWALGLAALLAGALFVGWRMARGARADRRGE